MLGNELSEEEVRSIKALAFAMGKFEPFPGSVIEHETLDRLIDAGLAEKGLSCRPAVGLHGYRLTNRGWRIANERWNWEKASVEA